MVFQDYALYPHMTVRRNLEFPLKMRKLSQAEIARQVQWVVELLSLGGLLDRLPRQLSGGQRQRVAMGRALVRKPAVFLMDEPLSNLDARLRVQIRAELGELLDRLGATTLYVTHDQAEAMTLGDRVAVIESGPPATSRPAAGVIRASRQYLRGRLHRQPADESVPGSGDFSVGRWLSASLGRANHAAARPMADRQWDGLLTAGLRPEYLRLANGATGLARHGQRSLNIWAMKRCCMRGSAGMDAPGSTLVTATAGASR
jgi:ABC-type sugar transport system ATPase subunit